MKSLLLTTLLFTCSSPAFAQVRCGPTESVYEFLQSNYQEVRNYFGVIDPSSIMELFVNEETSSWSILQTYTDGMSCLRSAGTNFTEMKLSIPEGDGL